ncbi:hypothetical protein Tco_0460292, partial [Tanacetum coccineum]
MAVCPRRRFNRNAGGLVKIETRRFDINGGELPCGELPGGGLPNIAV